VARLQTRRWCRYCERKTLHERATLNSTLGCLLSVLTLGLFIPVWILIGLFEALTVSWKCQTCGGAKRL